MPIVRQPVIRHFALSYVAIGCAIYNYVLRARARTHTHTHTHTHTQKLKLSFFGKPPPQKRRVLKIVSPTAVPVFSENQKNAWMDSEVFRDRFFFRRFAAFLRFFGNPTTYQLRCSWLVGTLLYSVFTNEWCSFKSYQEIHFSPYTGTTYTVSSGNCPSFSCATSSSLSRAYCRAAGPVSKMASQ